MDAERRATKRRPPLPRDAVICLMREDLADMLDARLEAVEMRRAWGLMKRRIGGRFRDPLRGHGETLAGLDGFLRSADATPDNKAMVARRGLQWARMVMAAAAVGEPRVHLAMSPLRAVGDWCWGLLFGLDNAVMVGTYPRQDITWLVQDYSGRESLHCWQEVFWEMLATDASRRLLEAVGPTLVGEPLPPAFAVHG